MSGIPITHGARGLPGVERSMSPVQSQVPERYWPSSHGVRRGWGGTGRGRDRSVTLLWPPQAEGPSTQGGEQDTLEMSIGNLQSFGYENCKRNNVSPDAKLIRKKGSDEGFLKQTTGGLDKAGLLISPRKFCPFLFLFAPTFPMVSNGGRRSVLSKLGARGFLPSLVREALTFSNSLSPQSPSNRPEHSLIKSLRLLEMGAEGLQTHKKALLPEYVEQTILHKYTFGQFSNASRWDCDRFNLKTHENITESQEPGRGP